MYVQLLNYIDISTPSLVCAAIMFIVVAYIVKSKFDSEKEKKEDYLIILYSVIAGILSVGLVLAGFKQFNKTSSTSILEGPYPSKAN